jgi:outer membrane protein assembly factor BamB
MHTSPLPLPGARCRSQRGFSTRLPLQFAIAGIAILLAGAARAQVATPITPVIPAAPGDWLRFRGPNGSGVAVGAQPPTSWSDTENVLWKTPLPGPGTSSPIVVGPRVFVTCYSGYGDGSPGAGLSKLQRHLVCVSRADGRILWSSTIPAAQPEDYFGGFLTEHGYASHTPTSDGERVYVFFGKSGAAAFDLTGRKLWQTSLGTDSNEKRWGSASSPILYKDLVIYNASEEGHALIALDKRSGKEMWRATGDALQYSFGTPILAQNGLNVDLVFSVPGELWGLNPDTGKLRWFAETGLPGNIAPSVIAGDGMVFAFGGYPALGAVAVRLGGKGDVSTHIAWRTHDSTYIPTPVLNEGRLYYVSDGGFAMCLDAKTGALVYKERLPGATATGRGKPFYASPVLANGALYAVSRRNGTFVLAAQPQFKLIAQDKISGDDTDFNATPAISGRQLFLRSNRFLYCIASPTAVSVAR